MGATLPYRGNNKRAIRTNPLCALWQAIARLPGQGVYSTIRRPQVELLEVGRGSPFWAAIVAFKAHAQATIAQMLPEPYAALLTGILLGVETGIPRGWYSPQNAIPICA